MSGSYDRPPVGRRDPATSQSAASFDPYDTVLTGPSGPDARFGFDPAPLRSESERRPERSSRTRSRRNEREPSNTPVVPPDSVTGRSLTLVISIMCFLACLTAGAVYMINESAKAWQKDIASEVTVQITPQENVDTEKTVADVKAFLEKRSGIARANALSLKIRQTAGAVARQVRCARRSPPSRG
jgi:cell division transport system permease protein